MDHPQHVNCRCVLPSEEDYPTDTRLRFYATRRTMRYELLLSRGASGRVAARAHLSDSRQATLLRAVYGQDSPEYAALVSLETDTDHLACRADLRRMTRPLQWQKMLLVEGTARRLTWALIALARVRARCNLAP